MAAGGDASRPPATNSSTSAFHLHAVRCQSQARWARCQSCGFRSPAPEIRSPADRVDRLAPPVQRLFLHAARSRLFDAAGLPGCLSGCRAWTTWSVLPPGDPRRQCSAKRAPAIFMATHQTSCCAGIVICFWAAANRARMSGPERPRHPEDLAAGAPKELRALLSPL